MAAKFDTLKDTFDTQVDPLVWQSAGAVAWDPSGRMSLTEASAGYATVNTALPYDIMESYIYFHLTPMLLASLARETIIQLGLDAANYIMLGITGNPQDLLMRVRVAGVNDSGGTPYNPTAHAWLKVRVTSSVIYWEGSPDGVTWTILRSVPTAVNFNSCVLMMQAGQWAADAGALQTVYIDNVNTPPAPTGGGGVISGINNSTSDFEKAYLVSAVSGATGKESISDLEYKYFGCTPPDTLSDGRRKYILANVAGALPTDSAATLDRKYYASILGTVPAAATNPDAEYSTYKTLAP